MDNGINALPPFNDVLRSILGRPNFNCADIADCLRHSGMDIPFKSEDEQARSIYFLLNEYLGREEPETAEATKNWELKAVQKLTDMRPVSVGRVKASRLMKLGEKAVLTRIYITDMVPDAGDPIWFGIIPLKGSLVDGHYFIDGQSALNAYKRDFSLKREFKDVAAPAGSFTMLEMLEHIATAEKEQLTRINAETVPGDKVFTPKH